MKCIENDCSLLVNSCDAYADAWKPFFRILHRRWSDLCMPVYLNTEHKKCDVPEFEVHTLNYEGNHEWGGRLKSALENISTEFVLVMLEDFFLQGDVRSDIIEQCLGYMRNDSEISCISFLPVGKYFHENNAGDREEYPGFVRRNNNERYILCCVPALWRRKDLIFFTKNWQNPWIWEAYGHYYVRKSRKKFYCRLPGRGDVFLYDVVRGGAIHRGKWVGCSVRKILKDNDITVDLEKRGVVEDWTLQGYAEKISLARKLKNRIYIVRSLIS